MTTVEIKTKPDFNNLLTVLKNEKPAKPTLFEFFLNDKLYSHLAGEDIEKAANEFEQLKIVIKAFHNAGYDYATIPTWLTNTFEFPKDEFSHSETRSLNEGNMITDREGFEKYSWPDPENYDYDIYKRLWEYVPEGMKLVGCGPGGILENVIDIMGFETLSIQSLMDPDFTQEVFDAVGSRLLKYYQILGEYDSIGALIVNDDWGFKTQTMLDSVSMRKYVIPWHKKMVEAIHASGKPAIMHSCGNLDTVMDDVIDDIKFDGKHSYEDEIIPVEMAYQKWADRIAIIGGIDLDFLVRKSPEDIYQRSKKMLELSTEKGGYALGSGNSIPHYVPFENFFAMLRAAV